MAKSIRSKRMRKLRAFKRIRYGEKELARLKNMLAKAAEEEKQNAASSSSTDVNTQNSNGDATAQVMEVDTQAVKTEVTKPSKYPCWLSHFKVKKLAKIERKCKRKEAKRLKKEQKKELKTKKSKKKNKNKNK